MAPRPTRSVHYEVKKKSNQLEYFHGSFGESRNKIPPVEFDGTRTRKKNRTPTYTFPNRIVLLLLIELPYLALQLSLQIIIIID